MRPVTLPGRLSFAWESPTWGGGIAFFSPSPAGAVRATAYLVTTRQFSDVFAQEMWREPGVDLDLAPLLAGGSHAVGPGRYETLHLAGTVDELPGADVQLPSTWRRWPCDLPPRRTSPPWPAAFATPTGSRPTRPSTTSSAPTGSPSRAATTAWTRQSLTTLVTSVHP